MKIQLQPKNKKKNKNLDQKNDDKNIIKYKKDIENIAKHACYYCKTLHISNSSCFQIIF
jgi:hypothetical protein